MRHLIILTSLLTTTACITNIEDVDVDTADVVAPGSPGVAPYTAPEQSAQTAPNPAGSPIGPFCDPFTQKSVDDGPETFCGAPLDADGNQIMQCVAYPSGAWRTDWTCMSVLHPENRHRHVLEADEQFVNACAPGYLPLLMSETTGTPMCTALCAPDGTVRGTLDSSRQDDSAMLDPTEECRYWYGWLDEGAAPVSTMTGFAYDYARRGGPSCAGLDVEEGEAWGCVESAL